MIESTDDKHRSLLALGAQVAVREEEWVVCARRAYFTKVDD